MSIDAAIDAIIRLADAAERIANALETMDVDGGVSFAPAAAGLGAALATASTPAIDGLEKPKRVRRTKAEMEAARRAEMEAAAPAPVVQPPAPVVQPPAFVAPPAPAPVVQPPAMSPSMTAVMANAAAPVVVDPFDGYMDMTPEAQFTKFIELAGPHFNIPAVRDAIVNTVESAGLTLPLSSPEDRTRPNDAYIAADPNTRFLIHFQTHKAIEAAKAASRPSTGL